MKLSVWVEQDARAIATINPTQTMFQSHSYLPQDSDVAFFWGSYTGSTPIKLGLPPNRLPPGRRLSYPETSG
ncbi:MAG: hypothetical protein LVT47_01155 [Cyanobacteria bacterium LVE1205-1]